jgi:large subunit ribosomal protein L13
MQKTFSPTAGSIAREWHLFDAKDQVLGRMCTEIAKKLMGKDKTTFVRHLDIGDHVVVINAKEVATTGRKEKQKMYHRHSGYPGGMVITPLELLRQTHPDRVIIHAVSGMLPHNKLHDKLLTHLHVYPGSDHPYAEQFKQVKENTNV